MSKPEDFPEVFRGNLEECLGHISERVVSLVPKGSRGSTIFRKPMVDFMGISDDTAQRLLYGLNSVPSCENRIKLMFFLDLNGYKVLELEKIRRKTALGYFVELIGYSIVSAVEAAQLVGYHTGGNQRDASTLYEILRGDGGVSREKEDNMWAVWRERRTLVEEKKELALRNNRLDFSSHSAGTLNLSKTSRLRDVATVNILENVLTLLEEISDDELRSLTLLHPQLKSRLISLNMKLQEGGKGGTENV